MAEKNLHVIYRISDKGNPKPKLSNGGKWDCLFNAVKEFGAENFHVIADNCRFWDTVTHEKLDKDRFRQDLGGVKEAYQEMLQRLTL